MKEGWKYVQLDDLCLIEYGTRVVNKRDGGSIYPVYGGGGATFFMDVHNREDCFIVSRFAMSEKCTRFVKGKFFLNDSGLSVKPKNSDAILQTFLNWHLFSLNDTIYNLAKGTAQKNLDVPTFRNLELHFPVSLLEQQRIVSVIDESFEAIDKAIENTQKNLQNAKELFESYLNESINNNSWEDKNFVDICEISSKLIDPRKSEYQNLIHIGAGNIETKTGVLLGLKTAKEENLISGKFLFDESTVLYSKIRPYLIKVVNCNFIGLCSADIYPLKPFKNMVIKDFLYFVLLSKRFTEYAILGSQRAGMPKVNRDHLFSYKLKIPPLEEQLILVEKFNRISSETKAIESKYQQKLRDLEELKKSILNRAFAGEL
jgi:type I restriction enzyme S subunit